MKIKKKQMEGEFPHEAIILHINNTPEYQRYVNIAGYEISASHHLVILSSWTLKKWTADLFWEHLTLRLFPNQVGIDFASS